MDEINEKTAVEYAEKLVERGMSGATYNYHIGFLKLIFKTLLPRAENSWTAARRRERSSARRKALSDAEIEKLLASVGDIELRRLLELGAYSGLRLCDALHLHSDSIKNDCIVLTPRKTSRQSGIEVKIPIHNRLKWLLDVKGAAFPSLLSHHKDTTSKVVIEAFRSAGFETTIEGAGKRRVCVYGYHSLRHSFISRLVNAGVPTMLVQSMAGHSSSKMTAHYYHQDTGALRDAINKL